MTTTTTTRDGDGVAKAPKPAPRRRAHHPIPPSGETSSCHDVLVATRPTDDLVVVVATWSGNRGGCRVFCRVVLLVMKNKNDVMMAMSPSSQRPRRHFVIAVAARTTGTARLSSWITSSSSSFSTWKRHFLFGLSCRARVVLVVQLTVMILRYARCCCCRVWMIVSARTSAVRQSKKDVPCCRCQQGGVSSSSFVS